MLTEPPLGLYVHVPWCVRKCPYCDFNSHVHKGELPEDRYVDALLMDLERQAAHVPGRVIETVFLGGGTPSLLAAQSIARLFTGIRERVDLAPDAEISLEANPGTVERGRFAGYRAAGVNRLSLGAQSFGARQLSLLGRIHSADDVPAAVTEIHEAGLSNFNLDLMYALPEQSLDDAMRDVTAAMALRPPHLSHYQLTLEPGTVFHTRPPVLPDEDLADAIEAKTHSALIAAGYRRYEVSAWAQPSAECRHNLNYWRYGDYLGIGAGAHGKRTNGGQIVRTERPKGPKEYFAAIEADRPPSEREIPVAERPFEFFLNALRLVDGIEIGTFESTTGLPVRVVEGALSIAAERGLLAPSASGWRPTPMGLRFLNDLQSLFLPRA
jgi:oxygen-independent coproporphyrinogen-3 oxidase